jgi:hypothetical protein
MKIQESFTPVVAVVIVFFLFQIYRWIKKTRNAKTGRIVLRHIAKQLPHQFLFVCHELSENPPLLRFKSILEMDEVLGQIRMLTSHFGYTYFCEEYGDGYSTFCLQKEEEIIHFLLCRQPPLSNSGDKATCMLRPHI